MNSLICVENHTSAMLATATNFGGSFSEKKKKKKDWKQAKNVTVHGYFTVSIAKEKIF